MNFSQGNFLSNIPTITKNLLIINVLMWVAAIVIPRATGFDVTYWLGLHFWRGADFNAAQMVTYMFLHDTSGPMHIFFNMFSLWMFGRILERVLGPKRFLFYYLVCGIGAAVVQEVMWELTWRGELVALLAQSNPGTSAAQLEAMLAGGQLNDLARQFSDQLITVGASGAVFGILLAFGMIFPNMPMYIIPFPFPIKAKWMVLGYGLIELFFGVSGFQASVAHFAHLGGMLFGFFTIWYWKRNGAIGGYGNGYY